MTIVRFLEWYPRYRKSFSDPVYKELYSFLSSPQSIWAMAQACEAGKPALNGVVKELEDSFEGRFDFDNPVNRRMIGSMIKEILHDFGFRRKGQRMVSNSRYFTTASYYELENEKAEKTVAGLFKIMDTQVGESGTKPETARGLEEEETAPIELGKRSSSVYAEDSRRTETDLEGLIQVIEDEKSESSEKRDAIKKLSTIGVTSLNGVSAIRKALDYKTLKSTVVEALTRIASSTYQTGGASDIVFEFIWMLRDHNPEYRLMAAEALGKIGAPGATAAAEALAEALRDEDEEVRRASAWALYEIGHPAFRAASPALVYALEDEDEEVREAAAKALGVCVPTSVNLLVELLEHDEPHVCRMAVFELGRAGEYARVDSAPGLIKALSSDDVELKGAAAWALGNIKETTEEAVAALLKALEDENGSVREKAAWALGKIGAKIKDFDCTVLYMLLKDNHKNVRKAAAWALGNIVSHSDDPTTRLMELIQDGSKHVREKTVWALGKICANSSRSKPVIPLLIEALSDEDWAVRKATAQALGRMGYFAVKALPALVRVQQDLAEKTIVRDMADWAIEEIGSYSTKETS